MANSTRDQIVELTTLLESYHITLDEYVDQCKVHKLPKAEVKEVLQLASISIMSNERDYILSKLKD